MNAFLSGAAGALAVLFLAALVRRALWRRWRRGGRFGARHVLRRIGARPEQEKAVLSETDALAEALRELRGDALGLREDLAELIASPALDPGKVAAALDARLAKARELRARFADALSRIHATLDPAQRAQLADLLRSGPHRHGCGRWGARTA
ncbi:MAG TPA: periplasmic heavy metal sensor [Anaeromyxobacter sp.]